MIHTRTAGLLGALLLSALLLAGCGGGGGEPTVSQGVHDVLQHELDDALAELRAEREAKTREAAARRTAQGEVTRLNTELATANTEVTRLNTELATTNAKVTQLEGERATATAEVTRLTGRIGTAADAASAAESASLYAQLNHAKADVMRLEGELATATTNADDLTTKVTAANAKVTELTAQIGNKSDTASAAETASLHAQLNHANAEVVRLTAELSGTKSVVETLKGQLGTAQTRIEEETGRADEAEQEAQQARTEASQRSQTLEANQRAQGMLDVLSAAGFPAAEALTEFAAPSEAEVGVAKSNTLTFGPSTARRSSTTRSGFRYAKITDTFGRTRTVVVYTDRELSRKLLDHYGDHLQGTTQINVGDAGISITALLASNSPASLTSRIPPKRVPTDGYTSPADLTSLSGKVHGQNGTFRCTGTGCLITLTPTYTDHDSDGSTPDELTSLSMASTGTLVFEPGNASISLCEDIPASCAFDDDEYMVFGYWVEAPESATGTYGVRPFAEVTQGGTDTLKALPSTGTARYTGAAVGVYVESPPFGSAEIDKRQGEFEAAVSLTATFGGSVNGWINNFRPTPRGGSAAPRTSNWRVTLGTGTTGATTTGTATIDGLQSAGNWAAEFVQARSDAASDEPTAAVGVFKTSGQSLHIVGAFGAKRQ